MPRIRHARTKPVHQYPTIEDLLSHIIEQTDHAAELDPKVRLNGALLALFGDSKVKLDGRNKHQFDFDRDCFFIAAYVENCTVANASDAVRLYFGEKLSSMAAEQNVEIDSFIRRYTKRLRDNPEKFSPVNLKAQFFNAYRNVPPLSHFDEALIVSRWIIKWEILIEKAVAYLKK